ncbi:hypothetical protein GDO81_015535 [Engystomops pustulosus]|uniref:Uncharacterized protein n=1 Tax=Engystomops pustulosus TaxID=76066 RepID=A0AAV7ART4_ENGPU|nr:hypothetical protein GDO81_015535 [Engystomops pustulosus]
MDFLQSFHVAVSLFKKTLFFSQQRMSFLALRTPNPAEFLCISQETLTKETLSHPVWFKPFRGHYRRHIHMLVLTSLFAMT